MLEEFKREKTVRPTHTEAKTGINVSLIKNTGAVP